MTGEIDFAAIAEPVARELLGEPNRRMSSRTELRFGNNGSTSILIAGEHRGQFFDHEAKVGGGVLALIAHRTGRANGAAIEWLHEHGFIEAQPQDKQQRIVATYPYNSTDGNLLFEVVRYEPKTFRQRRPDGNGGWAWNLRGVDRVLYRLPELLAADSADPVFVVEGEKDTDALRALGLVATTNSGGSGKWQASFAEPLRGRHVVVLPDNDDAGRKHAADVTAKLRSVAASVRVVELPGLPPRGDASDWLAAGGTAAKLLDMLLDSDEGGAANRLRTFLSIEAWAARDLPPPDRLLGDLITTTTRAFLVGRTGLGKTMLGFAMACGMASGAGFLHWRAARPARVLYVDGEMSAELIRARAIDALRRIGSPQQLSNLTIYARDAEEATARVAPSLGTMPPLNTEAGQNFVHALIEELGGVDVVIFDNVMSLIAGDQKDEIPWTDTLPLVASLTAKRIGQLWLDHTGHNSDRQYGSATKSWRFDTVGLMTPLADDQRAPREVAFQLTFDSPGKARRRTPENWQDFAPTIIRLVDDRWTSEPAGSTRQHVSARLKLFHDALLDALASGAGCGPGKVTRAAWMAECVRRSLIEPVAESATRAARERANGKLRKAAFELQAARWIGADGDTFTELTRLYTHEI